MNASHNLNTAAESVSEEDEQSNTAFWRFAPIKLGRVFGIELDLSVYYLIDVGLSGWNTPLFINCWMGVLALVVSSLCTVFTYSLAGLAESCVARRFGGKAKAMSVLPSGVAVSYKQLKVSRKGFVAIKVTWALIVLGFCCLWSLLTLLLLHTHGHPNEDCVSKKHFFTWIAQLGARDAWVTLLVMLILPIWPGPCFMTLCIVISKFGVPKKATLLMMGAVSVSLCVAGIVASLKFKGMLWLLGEIFIYIYLLVVNVIWMGSLLLCDYEEASLEPFTYLKEENCDEVEEEMEVEMDGQPLLTTPPS